MFPSDIKIYSREDLGIHNRKGDGSDTSHKGHPLCKFCDVRYNDDDMLYSHLRKVS